MKTLWFYTITLLSLLLVGCNNGDDGLLDIPSVGGDDVASLVVTPENGSIPVGLTQQLKAELVNSEQDVLVSDKLEWQSLNESVATVDSNGLVVGQNVGEVKILATAIRDGIEYTNFSIIKVTPLELFVLPEESTIPIGLNQQLTMELRTTDGNVLTFDKSVWKSSNESVATVDSNGLVLGESVGETQVSATVTRNGIEYTDTAIVYVSPARLTGLSVSPKVSTVPVGMIQEYTATASFSDGSSRIVTDNTLLQWGVRNGTGAATVSNINTVDEKVQVKGESVGDVIITASGTIDGKTFSDSASLSVTDAIIKGLQVKPNSSTILVGESQEFIAEAILSNNSSYPMKSEDLIWSIVGDEAIATIDASGIAKGLSSGKVEVQAQDRSNLSISDTANLIVEQKIDANVAPEAKNVHVFNDGTTTITLAFNYYDADGDPAADNQKYKWKRNGELIPDATSNAYTPNLEDVILDGKLAQFEGCVIPVAQTGVLEGEEVCSNAEITLNPDGVIPPSAVPQITGIPQVGNTIQSSYTYMPSSPNVGGEESDNSTFFWLVHHKDAPDAPSLYPCTSGAGVTCDYTIDLAEQDIQACVFPISKEGGKGELSCVEVGSFDVNIAGQLEYGEKLTVSVKGLDSSSYSLEWRMNLDDIEGPSNDISSNRKVIPVEQGGSTNTSYRIGTLDIAFADGADGADGSVPDGVITDNEWDITYPDTDWLKALPTGGDTVKPAAFFIGKDVTVCLITDEYGDVCEDASSFQSKDGQYCKNKDECVVGGIYFNADEPSIYYRGVSPRNEIEVNGVTFYRPLSKAELLLNSEIGITGLDEFYDDFKDSGKANNYVWANNITYTWFSTYSTSEISSYESVAIKNWPDDINPNVQYCIRQNKSIPVSGFTLPPKEENEFISGYGDADVGGDTILRNDYMSNNTTESIDYSLYSLFSNVFDFNNWFASFGSDIQTSTMTEYKSYPSPTTGWFPRNYIMTASRVYGKTTTSNPNSLFYHSFNRVPDDFPNDTAGKLDVMSGLTLHPTVICIDR
ncbi:Ig-like domain-containing protein [Vibrio parahaemolyticus]|uniref:Ig-like domain-containing protein n=1 Tax=Vibrio parahaemolyticus TaxID=670 RepID=UPI00387B2237|nr:Ig-like domain-containing protein [Vibrio parahaemolyticus]